MVDRRGPTCVRARNDRRGRRRGTVTSAPWTATAPWTPARDSRAPACTGTPAGKRRRPRRGRRPWMAAPAPGPGRRRPGSYDEGGSGEKPAPGRRRPGTYATTSGANRPGLGRRRRPFCDKARGNGKQTTPQMAASTDPMAENPVVLKAQNNRLC